MKNKNEDRDKRKPVSSAELTALWRSSSPSISYDNLSRFLVSEEAHLQSNQFIQFHDYPLITRKISARAGYIFTQATRLIETYNCDAIISFACGYSMLGFLIAQNVHKDITVVDTDLDDILQSRESRYQYLPLNESQQSALSQVQHLVFDIEQAYLDQINLASFFKQYQRPLVILEGITYFLLPNTRDWLITQLRQWDNACIILEYWPENSFVISNKIKKSFEADLNKDFKEPLHSFMPDSIIEDLKVHYHSSDVGVGEAEATLSEKANEPNLLIDQHEYYPIRIFTGVPKTLISEP